MRPSAILLNPAVACHVIFMCTFMICSVGKGSVYGAVSDEEAVALIARDLKAVAVQWYQIGVLLGVKDASLQEQYVQQQEAKQALEATIRKWVAADREVNLRRLVEAVEHGAGGKNPSEAKKIKEKHTG